MCYWKQDSSRAAQLLVYIGAISILLIFAIMMTRRLMQTTESPFNAQPIAGLAGALIAFVILVVVIVQLWPLTPGTDSLLGARPPVDPEVLRGSVAALGRSLSAPMLMWFPLNWLPCSCWLPS